METGESVAERAQGEGEEGNGVNTEQGWGDRGLFCLISRKNSLSSLVHVGLNKVALYAVSRNLESSCELIKYPDALLDV